MWFIRKSQNSAFAEQNCEGWEKGKQWIWVRLKGHVWRFSPKTEQKFVGYKLCWQTFCSVVVFLDTFDCCPKLVLRLGNDIFLYLGLQLHIHTRESFSHCFIQRTMFLFCFCNLVKYPQGTGPRGNFPGLNSAPACMGPVLGVSCHFSINWTRICCPTLTNALWLRLGKNTYRKEKASVLVHCTVQSMFPLTLFRSKFVHLFVPRILPLTFLIFSIGYLLSSECERGLNFVTSVLLILALNFKTVDSQF